jgi:hypothetical protein
MSQQNLQAFINQPSSAEDSPANRLAHQDSGEDTAILDISGRECYELSKNYGLVGFLERMLLTSSAWHSTRRYLIWKVRDTPQRHLIFRLVASMPGTKGKECLSLLPTPDTMPEAPNKSCNRKYPKNLLQAAMDNYIPQLLPTPSALNGHNCGTFQEWGGAWNKLRGSTLASGKVNPVWEEWLMGFPVDWTNLEDNAVAMLLEMPSSRSKSTRSSKRLQTSKTGCPE